MRIPLRLTIALLPVLAGCQSSAPAPKPAVPAETFHYPARPTVAAPPIKLFHQDNDTLTLTTIPDATDEQIEAVLWELRDANHQHTFDALHLPQAFIDARKPKVWFHVYRGPKCASEKYTTGKLPCEAAYHGAGDYTLGSYTDPNYEAAELRHPDGSLTELWNPDEKQTH
jgi:hypothetical protein